MNPTDHTETATMTILMVGNLFEGWCPYGPFEDDNAAQAWAEEQGWRIGEEATICQMAEPFWPEDEDDGGER